ncbi:MAG: FAD-binding oxidoreductase [Bacteroidetes bacterium]|nr:FAD-binding oxidoreductase [Bacteroidota bacterium]MBX7129495.1 FAD-binding oxidoreductase [Flavobacteriales bacterium]MCC6654577.1 FAD-binding oxidoreductase [Flavobacteriales bacterium]HMU13314.1 FAD-dependent oxidoreductase [Flavobacteriales bacterium]HMZ47915.1 FAD-dependent oxidoreductase [Flavobacteriales bacterium]
MAEPHVAVVGAGITGLFTALHHKRRYPGHRVVVLERGPHPIGASVKNAGFACFGSPSEILADVEAEGAEAAVARVQERWLGLRELRTELGDERIGFEATGGHEVFMEDDALYTKVADRFDELNRLLHPVFGHPAYQWLNRSKSDMGLRAGPIARTDLEGPIDGGALMRALLEKAREAGVDVRFGQPVSAVEEDGSGVVLRMSHDLAPVRAARVVIATNGFANELIPGIDVRPARGQVLLTSPVPGLRLKGTFHAHEGYYYFRDHRGCVLLGGGRHLDKAGETTTEDAVTPLIQDALERMLREVIIPGADFTIEHRWSGVMGFRTKGKTALVERVSPRVVVAAGLSGMGVAIGVRVAHKAAGLLVE